ncbi:MAG: threonine--tRNA ligase [Candidatus Micrarchaeaceae archaeon]
MRILQLDVNNITYEPISPEAEVYDEAKKEKVSVNDALVLMVSVEKGDSEELAAKAAEEAGKFMDKLGRNKVVVYPYAHLSSNLASPKEAIEILNEISEELAKKHETIKAPFGWNKKLSIDIKGHPLAEQSRSYSLGESEGGKARTGHNTAKVNTAIVRKSDFSGLPETDHRTISENQNLFSFQEVSPGMVYWHKNGHILYRELVKLMREQTAEHNYDEISTPAIANVALWHVSGHIEHYRDNMFVFDSEGEKLGLKPMNCPSTMLIYKSRRWSYKELPFRTAIFDKIYRNEISGALTGLFRVREMTQDDGHIFAREDQIGEEIKDLLEIAKKIYALFGMSYKLKLSTMPKDHMGDEKLWNEATNVLAEALKSLGLEYEVKEGEGAFYGPKIDGDVTDSMGRNWQCLTIQLDYQLPIRFNLEYTGEDGKPHVPVVIHRAILGSIERFVGVLIEHYQGRFPTWLAPVQVEVVPISEQVNTYADAVLKSLRKKGLRAELDDSDRTLEYKIRSAQLAKIPYMLVIGKKEEQAGAVTVRTRDNSQKPGVKLEEFEEKLEKEIKERSQKLSY